MTSNSVFFVFVVFFQAYQQSSETITNQGCWGAESWQKEGIYIIYLYN